MSKSLASFLATMGGKAAVASFVLVASTTGAASAGVLGDTAQELISDVSGGIVDAPAEEAPVEVSTDDEVVEATPDDLADEAEAPADEVEDPADVVEAPADEVEDPADVVEDPAEEVEEPAEVEEGPAHGLAVANPDAAARKALREEHKAQEKAIADPHERKAVKAENKAAEKALHEEQKAAAGEVEEAPEADGTTAEVAGSSTGKGHGKHAAK